MQTLKSAHFNLTRQGMNMSECKSAEKRLAIQRKSFSGKPSAAAAFDKAGEEFDRCKEAYKSALERYKEANRSPDITLVDMQEAASGMTQAVDDIDVLMKIKRTGSLTQSCDAVDKADKADTTDTTDTADTRMNC